VFEDSVSAEAALKAGTIRPGEVVVLRGQGVLGGPGMGGASRLVFALEGAGMGAACAVVTDGQLSGLVNKGLVVGDR
jgi:dihydroxy-acid dehydratase